VNARLIAEERGISVRESRTEKAGPGYSATIEVSLNGPGGTNRVTGAMLADGMGRVVEIDGAHLEAVPHGEMLLVQNHDRPGIIGRLGSILGDAGINISRMQLGIRPDRQAINAEDGPLALSVINVDAPVDEAVLGRIRGAGVVSAKAISL